MSDAAMVEAPRNEATESSQKSGRWSFLERFKKKSTPVMSTEASVIPEPTPDSIPAQPQVEESIQEQAPKPEILKPAQKVYFHTAPLKNLPTIEEKGLFSAKSDPSLGENLSYSLYFDEHTAEDYILTFWEPNDNLMRARTTGSYQYRNKYGLETGFMEVRNTVPNGEVPEEFRDAAPYHDDQEIGQISPEHLLGSLILDKTTREEILKQMILVETGKMDASQIEEQLTRLLNGNPGFKIKDGFDTETLVHDIVSSLERSSIRSAIIPAVKKAMENPTVDQLPRKFGSEWGKDFSGFLGDAYWQVYARRSEVNDPVSARFLDGIKLLLEQKISDQGFDIEEINDAFRKKLADLTSFDSERAGMTLTNSDSLKMYFGNSTHSVIALKKEMDISRY